MTDADTATPGFSPPADCGKPDDDDKTNPRNKLWVEAKNAPDPLQHGYVVFGGDIMGFKAIGNGLLVPKTRIKGIECPKVVGQGAQNFWPSAWNKAEGLNLPPALTLVSVNSMDGRTQDQLHFHLTVLKSDVRTQLDKLDTKNLGVGRWNSNCFILSAKDQKTGKDDTYAYRVAHVDDLDKNPFDLLNDNVATQKDSHGNTYNDRFAQSLAIVRGPKRGPRRDDYDGYFLIATQGKPTQQGQPLHTPDLDLKDPTTGNRYYGTSTVEALIDRDWPR